MSNPRVFFIITLPPGIGVYTSCHEQNSPSFGRVGKERQRVSAEGSIQIGPPQTPPDPLPEGSSLAFDPPPGIGVYTSCSSWRALFSRDFSSSIVRSLSLRY